MWIPVAVVILLATADGTRLASKSEPSSETYATESECVAATHGRLWEAAEKLGLRFVAYIGDACEEVV